MKTGEVRLIWTNTYQVAVCVHQLQGMSFQALLRIPSIIRAVVQRNCERKQFFFGLLQHLEVIQFKSICSKISFGKNFITDATFQTENQSIFLKFIVFSSNDPPLFNIFTQNSLCARRRLGICLPIHCLLSSSGSFFQQSASLLFIFHSFIESYIA